MSPSHSLRYFDIGLNRLNCFNLCVLKTCFKLMTTFGVFCLNYLYAFYGTFH